MSQNSKKYSSLTCAFVLSQLCLLSSAFAVDQTAIGSGAISSLEKSQGEVCIVPATIPELGSGVAEKKQKELCAIDFYNDPKTAICPKQFSTNPAVEPYSVPDGITQAEYEAKDCSISEKKRPGKKLAKFKSTITCSDTGSILSYFELSQILGGAGMVPPTVFRTMDLDEHRKIVAKGEAGVLRSSWSEFVSRENAVSSHPELFTKDGKFLYGALSENPGGDSAYSDFVGHPKNYADGFHALTQTPLFLEITSQAPIGAPKTLAGAAQKVIALKDMSDMILMDTILNQQDRFGNEAKQEFYVWVEEGKIQEQAEKKADKTEMAQKQAVLVNKLLMKDNDCGVSKTNWMKKNNVLSELHHMSAQTYQKFMAFAKAVAANPSQYSEYFQTQMVYTQADWSSVSGNIASSRATLLNNCKSGKLVLDLDLESYLGLSSDLSRACE